MNVSIEIFTASFLNGSMFFFFFQSTKPLIANAFVDKLVRLVVWPAYRTCIGNVMLVFHNWSIAMQQNLWTRHNWNHDCSPHGSQTEMWSWFRQPPVWPYWMVFGFDATHVDWWWSFCVSDAHYTVHSFPQTDDWQVFPIYAHTLSVLHTTSLVHQNVNSLSSTNPCPQCAKQRMFSCARVELYFVILLVESQKQSKFNVLLTTFQSKAARRSHRNQRTNEKRKRSIELLPNDCFGGGEEILT